MRQFAMLLSVMVCRSDAPRGFWTSIDRRCATGASARDDDADRKLLRALAAERRRFGVVAKRIVELARDGERDPNKLCEHALQTLGFFLGGDVRAKWTSDRAPLTRKEIVAKRVLDLLIAGAALVLLWPLLALICLSIKLEGRSPSILQQRRAAFSGREFAVYNFTTTAWEGACIGQARRNDSRVTRVGRLLKATGLDELPQLFSVLGGQMSLVGPPPHAIDPKGEFSDPIAPLRDPRSTQARYHWLGTPRSSPGGAMEPSRRF